MPRIIEQKGVSIINADDYIWRSHQAVTVVSRYPDDYSASQHGGIGFVYNVRMELRQHFFNPFG